MDAQRAMREARYAQRVTRPTVAPPPVAPTTRTPARATARTEPATPQPATEQPATAEAGLCGHRAISGRTCTREQGHTAKSHRYA